MNTLTKITRRYARGRHRPDTIQPTPGAPVDPWPGAPVDPWWVFAHD